ncbi:MAG: tripartite tricarboxylate transporter substrate binding protein [Burkholderiales bacterium]|nr:tripartite tricarboxylate transporter substrate binding protein [Burkholderiales bacterium]
MMKAMVCLLGAAACTASAAPVLAAESYPARPVRLIIPFAAGGATDVPTRITASRLGERLGVQFVIDNRPGQGGALGAAIAARAEPDGYTVLMTATPFVVSPHVYSKLSYDPLADFVPVTQFGSAPNVLVVHPSLPAKTTQELVKLAQSQPGKLDWASSGTGGGQHLFGELFMSMAKIRITHISYKGSGAAAADLLGGQVKIGFPGIAIALPHHNAKRLLALGVTTAKRNEQMPEVPSIAEAVAGYDATFWLGMVVPKGTPRAVIDRLYQETTALLQSPDVIAAFRKTGTDAAPSGPAEFGKFIRSEYDKWGKVIREVGIKAN